jgi:hypothetical protein
LSLEQLEHRRYLCHDATLAMPAVLQLLENSRAEVARLQAALAALQQSNPPVTPPVTPPVAPPVVPPVAPPVTDHVAPVAGPSQPATSQADQQTDQQTTDQRTVVLREGPQVIQGTAADQVFYLLGDAGEPSPEQDANAKFYKNEVVPDPDDVVTGGGGSDLFVFMPLLNAKPEIIDEHRGDGGFIDWPGVSGENGNAHDHWMEGIGRDVITDYARGDRLRFDGHTVKPRIVTTVHLGNNRWRTDIALSSDQGAAGAHNKDFLGLVSIFGDRVLAADLEINSHPYHNITLLDKGLGIQLGLPGATTA